jgi:RimJ/RimL family protein N-acetyltransferase
MENTYWPIFDLRIRSERVELRLPSDEDLVVLARLAAKGVHDPSTMPFLKPWTDQPSPNLERGLLQWGWRHRARWSANDWTFGCCVSVDGEIVGVQDLMATNFAVTRGAKTGSWLGREHQGQGIGKAMREAMLSFAFGELDASVLFSGGFPDNDPSLGVSRALGYEETGRSPSQRRGEPAEVVDMKLERSVWEARTHEKVEVTGFESCRDFFIESPTSPTGESFTSSARG